jgi:N-acetylneuraminic acid mutarotase
MGYTMMDNVLYIQGGFDTVTSSQFVSLDLSSSWSTSSPAWKKLQDGQATTHLAVVPISSASNGGAKGSLLSIGGMGANPFFSSYDVSTESWQMLATVKAPYTYLEGHSAVSDPHTGLVYIVGGYGNSTYNLLSVYDPKTKAMVSQASATAATSLTDIGAVWLNSRNTILTFGGTRATPATPQGLGDLNEYDPSSKTWSTMVSLAVNFFFLGPKNSSPCSIHTSGIGVILCAVGNKHKHKHSMNTKLCSIQHQKPTNSLQL